MDPQKEEFDNLVKNADQSRENSLILLICAAKSLVSLQIEFEQQQFTDNQIKQINQLLDCVENIIDLWLNKLNEQKVKSEELIELIEESDLLNVFGNLFYRNLTEKFTKIEKILHNIFSNLSIAKDNQIPFYLYLMVITQKFKDANGVEKFRISERLNSYLSKNLRFCRENEKVKNSIKLLAESLYDILQNKLSEELRSPIFALLANITYHYESLDWFIKPKDERRSFLPVSRLACIESRMCLETKLNDLNLLTNSLIIVEYSLKSLIEEDENSNKSTDSLKTIMEYLTNEDVIQLIDAIKLLMQSIVIHLNENRNVITDLQTDTTGTNKLNRYQFQVCLRVLCLYLAFENEFLQNEFEQIINLISGYILNELVQSERNNSLINLCLTALISIVDSDLPKYKEQLNKLDLIKKIESQMKNSKEPSEVNMFKSFLDSIVSD